MRIIHTSDWHLGQHFMGKSREPEHRDFLNWLLELIETSRADALVVAGDIFDTGTPPSYARTLYNEFIVKLQQTGCSQAVILGGNHDSASTLNEARAILACLNTHVFAGISQDPEDHVIMLKDRDGQPGLLLCAIPFLRPRDLVKSMAGQSGQDKQTAMAKAISSFYDQVFQVAKSHKNIVRKEGQDLPIMATGHLTVVGGKSSESVRDIYIGSLDAFPVAGFPGADYIALGHLHRAQAVKGLEHIQYSGSPIPLSFDEANRVKQVLQVDFAQGALDGVTPVPVPCFRKLVCIKGSLEEIEAGVSALPKIGKGRSLWLEAEVATDDYLTDLQDRILEMIQNRIDGNPFDSSQPDMEPLIDLLRVRRKRKKNSPGRNRESREKLEELNPKEVFLRRLAHEDLDEDQTGRLTSLFDEIMAQVQGEEI